MADPQQLRQTSKDIAGESFPAKLAVNIKVNYELYLFLLPAIVIIFIFNYIPMYGIQIAFRDFVPTKGFLGSDWVGMKHFIRFFNSNQFWSLMRNTLGLSAYGLVAGFPIPIMMALLINQMRHERFKRLVQTVIYMPHFISTVVVVGMILLFLSPSTGLYGQIARAFGMEPMNVLGMQQWFPTIYVLSGIWQHTGWESIIYLAVLANIDITMYEAATVDGASKWQKVIYIDIPSLIPTTVIMLTLSLGRIMNIGFEKAFLMQNPLNTQTSEIISTYVYKIGMVSSQYSYSTAIGLFNTAISFILLVAVNKISRKYSETSLW